MFLDYLKLVFMWFKKRKLRSFLTIIGIFIGVTAVVALISLGNGMNVAVNEIFKSVGRDKIFISPGGQFMGPTGASLTSSEITDKDIKVIEGVRGVEKVIGVLTQQAKISSRSQAKYVSVLGMPTDKETTDIISNMDFYMVSEGRQLKSGDKYKVVIGYKLSTDFFDKPVLMNDRIIIEGQEFQVIGIQKKSGSPVHEGLIRVPLETAREIFNIPQEYSMFIVQVKNGYEPKLIAEEIKNELRKSRDVDVGKEDFSVEIAETLISSVGVILSVIQVALIGIASISIIVGGIGIMNTTYTSIHERIKEIGIMKAVGAKNRDITFLFAIEAGLLGMIGGSLGVLAGSILAKIVEAFAASAGAELLKAYLSPALLIGALLFSFLVGLISGIIPAIKAANTNVIEAIQHE